HAAERADARRHVSLEVDVNRRSVCGLVDRRSREPGERTVDARAVGELEKVLARARLEVLDVDKVDVANRAGVRARDVPGDRRRWDAGGRRGLHAFQPDHGIRTGTSVERERRDGWGGSEGKEVLHDLVVSLAGGDAHARELVVERDGSGEAGDLATESDT